jgi:hypothetical protein
LSVVTVVDPSGFVLVTTVAPVLGSVVTVPPGELVVVGTATGPDEVGTVVVGAALPAVEVEGPTTTGPSEIGLVSFPPAAAVAAPLVIEASAERPDVCWAMTRGALGIGLKAAPPDDPPAAPGRAAMIPASVAAFDPSSAKFGRV